MQQCCHALLGSKHLQVTLGAPSVPAGQVALQVPPTATVSAQADGHVPLPVTGTGGNPLHTVGVQHNTQQLSTTQLIIAQHNTWGRLVMSISS